MQNHNFKNVIMVITCKSMTTDTTPNAFPLLECSAHHPEHYQYREMLLLNWQLGPHPSPLLYLYIICSTIITMLPNPQNPCYIGQQGFTAQNHIACNILSEPWCWININCWQRMPSVHSVIGKKLQDQSSTAILMERGGISDHSTQHNMQK